MSMNPSDTSPENRLVPQPEQNLIPAEPSSILRLRGKRAMIVTGLGLVAAHFSTFFNWGRRFLEGLQGYDYLASHNTKSIASAREFVSNVVENNLAHPCFSFVSSHAANTL
jgi:hypothetical protein